MSVENQLCDDCGDPWHSVPCGWGDKGTPPGWKGFKGETRCQCQSDWHDDPSRTPQQRVVTAKRESKPERPCGAGHIGGGAVLIIIVAALLVLLLVVGSGGGGCHPALYC